MKIAFILREKLFHLWEYFPLHLWEREDLQSWWKIIIVGLRLLLQTTDGIVVVL